VGAEWRAIRTDGGHTDMMKLILFFLAILLTHLTRPYELLWMALKIKTSCFFITYNQRVVNEHTSSRRSVIPGALAL
jgi:hypothetical protein